MGVSRQVQGRAPREQRWEQSTKGAQRKGPCSAGGLGKVSKKEVRAFESAANNTSCHLLGTCECHVHVPPPHVVGTIITPLSQRRRELKALPKKGEQRLSKQRERIRTCQAQERAVAAWLEPSAQRTEPRQAGRASCCSPDPNTRTLQRRDRVLTSHQNLVFKLQGLPLPK